MSENLVIIPTYNEKENIEKIIRYVFEMPMSFDILIIEDNSPTPIRSWAGTTARRKWLPGSPRKPCGMMHRTKPSMPTGG